MKIKNSPYLYMSSLQC